MTNRDIGARVQGLRQELGMTTTRLAERIGISQAQVSRLENGLQGFRSTTLMKIAKALGKEPFYFLMTDAQWKAYERSAK